MISHIPHLKSELSDLGIAVSGLGHHRICQKEKQVDCPEKTQKLCLQSQIGRQMNLWARWLSLPTNFLLYKKPASLASSYQHPDSSDSPQNIKIRHWEDAGLQCVCLESVDVSQHRLNCCQFALISCHLEYAWASGTLMLSWFYFAVSQTDLWQYTKNIHTEPFLDTICPEWYVSLASSYHKTANVHTYPTGLKSHESHNPFIQNTPSDLFPQWSFHAALRSLLKGHALMLIRATKAQDSLLLCGKSSSQQQSCSDGWNLALMCSSVQLMIFLIKFAASPYHFLQSNS